MSDFDPDAFKKMALGPVKGLSDSLDTLDKNTDKVAKNFKDLIEIQDEYVKQQRKSSKDGGKKFSDPHSSKKGIRFNGAGAAKTGSGGFVANRLILGHRLKPELERHLILSSGGRWRICDPQVDNRGCR